MMRHKYFASAMVVALLGLAITVMAMCLLSEDSKPMTAHLPAMRPPIHTKRLVQSDTATKAQAQAQAQAQKQKQKQTQAKTQIQNQPQNRAPKRAQLAHESLISDARAKGLYSSPFNNKPTPFNPNALRDGALSFYPEKPETLYLANIQAAKAGDANSQYKVARALQECAGMGDVATAKKHIEQSPPPKNNFEKHLNQSLLAGASHCAELHSHVPAKKLKTETEYWLNQALKQHQPMALAVHLNQNSSHFSDKKALQILQNAVNTKDYESYHYVSEFYYQRAGYIESGQFDADMQTKGDAWALVYCHHNPNCQPKGYDSIFSKERGYTPSTIGVIKDDAAQILQAIDEKALTLRLPR